MVLDNVTTTSLTNISVNQLHLEGEKVSIRDVHVKIVPVFFADALVSVPID